ncbi:phosphoribosyltransferase family protein [Micromonospora sp. R77]|uniref:phosphoribosyltransferase family protein n=1 Tax=Micromonospora sp. R77 TaxID=2925836 RepID=UPI001F620380|nr:phosphoribosyltransferase family protein [Micromonospora sp. R77]MCI4066026.1 phosphoribosyltransferase family protein [Micromonospora sp. R77]
MSVVWNGQWVADRLGLSLANDARPELTLSDLVGLALRRNPRRSHLIVSSVLGKHIPTDPTIVYGAGRLLGALAADCITGRDSGIAEVGPALLRSALRGSPDSATALLRRCAEHASSRPAGWPLVVASMAVLGYAETATALGHAVADALDADCLHSTRRCPPGTVAAAGFEEEHSHATRHLLLPEDPTLLARAGPLLLVDDELSTGRTALNTIAALHALAPRSRYVIASLVDLRSRADKARMASMAASLGAAVTVVALVEGHLDLPADAASIGQQLVGEHTVSVDRPTGRTPPQRLSLTGWKGIREGGRHGFGSHHRAALWSVAHEVAQQVASRLVGARVLVLGCEELMYAPLVIANRLKDLLGERTEVRFSSTTRSPVLPVDDAGYAIRNRLTFPSHDNPADGPGPRFAYNVAPGSNPDHRFTDILVVVDQPGDTAALHSQGGLLDQLAGCCDQVHLLTLPAYQPPPEPMPCPPPHEPNQICRNPSTDRPLEATTTTTSPGS